MTHLTRNGKRWVFGGLGLATIALSLLHVVEPTLDPLHEPVSFYIHGQFAWLLPLALGSFGGTALWLARAWAGLELPARSRRSLGLFGLGMLVTAIAPSDRWFPWEATPTAAGVIHATVAIVAPLLLLDPMVAMSRRRLIPSRKVAQWAVSGYGVSIVASAASLGTGLAWDRSPPWIGAAERLLAFTAVVWIALAGAQVPTKPRVSVRPYV